MKSPTDDCMTQGYVFKTHTTLLSSVPPRFNESFVRLSGNDSTERWLAFEGAEISFMSDAGVARRTVPSGAIVLCEHTEEAWTIAVPVARNAFDGEHTDDLQEPVSRGRRTGTKGTHV
jgi:hypothetical protein